MRMLCEHAVSDIRQRADGALWGRQVLQRHQRVKGDTRVNTPLLRTGRADRQRSRRFVTTILFAVSTKYTEWFCPRSLCKISVVDLLYAATLSVLWLCWFGYRKGIIPVKKGCTRSLEVLPWKTFVRTWPKCVAWWPSGLGARLAINRSRVRILAAALLSATLGKLFTHMPLSPNSIIWYQPMGGYARRLAAYCQLYGFSYLQDTCIVLFSKN